MTDRIKGLVIAFDRDIREEDVEAIVNAIRLIRGVKSISTNLANGDDWMNRERIRHELGQKLLEVVYPKEQSSG